MAEKAVDYKKLKLKVGLEVHQQLDTEKKLFCNCSTSMKEKDPIKIVMRKMHPVASELGEIDIAAEFEFLRNRNFHYQIFKNETCLVELDDEPPHPMNPEAIQLALQVALLLNCKVPEEIHVMRKTVIDGSNTSGFQRTAIIGTNGYLKYKGKNIPIALVALEEDAAAHVKEENGKVTYRLSRLGIPLVEVTTESLEGYSPKEIQEIAFEVGMICRSIGKVKREIGAIRQDLNVSIRGGNRVEVKGVQELGLLSKVIELEVKRQLSLPKVEKEVRGAQEDGTTKFMRPLPGAKRMYPETDIPPIPLNNDYIQELKKELPEPWTKKFSKFKSKYKLSDELSKTILNSPYLELFERIVAKTHADASTVANTFTSVMKDLEKREKAEINRIREEHYFELFDLIAKKRIMKEAIPVILKYLSEKPGETVAGAVKELDISPLTAEELKKIIEEVLQHKGLIFEKAYGIVMSKVRGRIDPQIVMKEVKNMMKP